MSEIYELTRTDCACCGATLIAANAVGGVVECEYCGNKYTLVRKETSPVALSYLRMGEHALDVCAFDEAYSAFERAAEADGNEPEAFFGMALAAFRVQYLKDISGEKVRMQPICHEISQKTFSSDKNFNRALSLATQEQKKEYARKGAEIDEIRKEFYELRASGLDYDCFICVKVTDDETKNATQDSVWALKLYHYLRDQGYKPFYSEEEIGSRAGVKYEALILYALYSSECMLLVCSNEDYLRTRWVKNEYTRFEHMLKKEEKDHDSITIVFNGAPIERLPGMNGKIQGINLKTPDAYSRIVKFVESHTPEAKARREAAALKKKQEEEERVRLLEEQKRELEESQRRAREELEEQQQNALRALEEKIKGVPSGGNAAPSAGATVNSLLIRAQQELDAREFARAKEYYTRVLDADPQNAEAWWGLFLVDYSTASEKEIVEKLSSVQELKTMNSNRNYVNAKRYASAAFVKRVDDFRKAILKKVNEIDDRLGDEISEKSAQLSRAQDSLNTVEEQATQAQQKNALEVRELENMLFEVKERAKRLSDEVTLKGEEAVRVKMKYEKLKKSKKEMVGGILLVYLCIGALAGGIITQLGANAGGGSTVKIIATICWIVLVLGVSLTVLIFCLGNHKDKKLKKQISDLETEWAKLGKAFAEEQQKNEEISCKISQLQAPVYADRIENWKRKIEQIKTELNALINMQSEYQAIAIELS